MVAEKNPSAESDSIAERTIGTTRSVSATPEQWFGAFHDPQRLARWWGPNGCTSTFQEFDLRPGGRWRLVQHSPDGTNYPNDKEFIEVRKPQRIVIRNHHPVHGFFMTIGFIPQGAGSLVTWQLFFDSADEAAKVRDLATPANEQNLDRLEAHLSTHV